MISCRLSRPSFQRQRRRPERVRLDWVIAPGYYLYRDRIKVSGEAAGVSVGAPEFPARSGQEGRIFRQAGGLPQ